MFKSYGYLRFEQGVKAVLDIDPEIVNYYYNLIPEYYNVNRQKYSSHITVIRSFEEPKFKLSMLEGHKVQFEYDGIIHYDHKYFWINAYSRKLEMIRLLSWLPRHRKDKNCFHFTIANKKILKHEQKI